MKRPTPQRIDALLSVDASTGEIRWKKSAGRVKAGDLAGGYDKNGYRRLSIDGEEVYAHQLVFFAAHGYWCGLIDHINGQRDDNRIENLRDATASENAKNRTEWRNGVKLGARRTPDGRWAARIVCDGVSYHLGVYATQEEAHEAYMRARHGSDQAAAVARKDYLSKLTLTEALQAQRIAA